MAGSLCVLRTVGANVLSRRKREILYGLHGSLREALRTNPSRYYSEAVAAGIVASIVCGFIYGSLLVVARISFRSFLFGVITAARNEKRVERDQELRYRLTAVVL